MTGYVETMKWMCSKPIQFQSRQKAREWFDWVNKGLRDRGIKSRVEYRLFGRGEGTIAFCNVKRPRR